MPSLSWRTARAEIATILGTVAITSPIAVTMERVYETQPKLASDFPAVAVWGVTKASPIRSAGLRERAYTARLRLVVKDADVDQAHDILDAFQEAIIDAFDQNLALNAKVSNLTGPEWLEPGPLDFGGQTRWGSDALVTFQMLDDPAFDE